MDYFPEVVQVIPYEDFTVSVYFSDGKIVLYDVKPFLQTEIFARISDINIFMGRCTILNDTLAWDIAGNRNESKCIDIDPDTLYQLPETVERTAEKKAFMIKIRRYSHVTIYAFTKSSYFLFLWNL